MTIKFEWDPAKSEANRAKHGVDFRQAVRIWEGVHVDLLGVARCGSESRSATLGWIDGKAYVVIWTRRGDFFYG